jgi:hypothetical protein
MLKPVVALVALVAAGGIGAQLTHSQPAHVVVTISAPAALAPSTTAPAQTGLQLCHEFATGQHIAGTFCDPPASQPAARPALPAEPTTTAPTTSTSISAPAAIDCPASGVEVTVRVSPATGGSSRATTVFACDVAVYGGWWTVPGMTVNGLPIGR